MEFRGPPAMRGPPNPQIRQRGAANHHINHHINHPTPAPHILSHQRFVAPNMNPQQWPGPHEESVNLAGQQYTPEVFNNYTFHPPPLPSPDLMSPPPPPQTYCTYTPQMYMPPRPIYVGQGQMWSGAAPMMQSQPMMAPTEVTSPRKLLYNSKDNILICSKCGHQNILWVTEINKRDDQIVSLERDNHELNAKVADLLRQIDTLKSEIFQDCKNKNLQDKEVPMKGQNEISKETSENPVKSDSEIEKEQNVETNLSKKLSPTAAVFSPSKTVAADNEVPVVSAKGVMDEDGESVAPVLEIEAGTQVEENLFEEAPDVLTTYPSESSNENFPTKVENENWSDEMDRAAKDCSMQGSELEQVDTSVPAATQVADSEWDEGATTSAPKNWREETPQTGSGNHWHQTRHNRSRQGSNKFQKFNREHAHQLVGCGRGRRTPQYDQEQNGNKSQPNDNYRQPFNEDYRLQHNVGNNNRQSNVDHFRGGLNNPHIQQRGGFSRQQSQRPRHEEMREKRDRFNYEGKNRNQKYSDHQNNDRDKSSPQGHEDQRDNKDNNRKTLFTRDMASRESEEKSQAQNTLPNSLIKEEKKESPHTLSQGPIKRNVQNQEKKDIPNIVKVISGDLFSAPGDFALAHCVAQDFRMGSGIAVKFKSEFKRVGELLDQNESVGGCAHLKVNDRYIFYLVTKEFSIGKPKYEDLQRSLRVMKEKCLKFGVSKLAMPRIGCGLDRLDWSRVRSHINETFADANMEIQVYDFNVEGVSEAEGNKPEGQSTLKVKYNEAMKLVEIAKDTALIFLGTENGFMDPTAKSLDEKHHFEMEYKKTEKTVGSIWVYKKPNTYDWVYGLIVAKTENDRIKFSNVEACCFQLSKMLRKDEFRFVGIEYPQGWSPERTFFEKILTLLRFSLPKFMELWVCYPSEEMDFSKEFQYKEGRNKDFFGAK